MTIGTSSHCTGHRSDITTTTVAAVKTSTDNTRELCVLLDTGCSSTILSNNYSKNVKNIKKSESHYSITGGLYQTSSSTTLTFKLPEFSMSTKIT